MPDDEKTVSDRIRLLVILAIPPCLVLPVVVLHCLATDQFVGAGVAYIALVLTIIAAKR